MTPEQAILSLDHQIADHGEDVTYHVIAAGEPDAGTPIRAFVRGYAPDELVGGLTQKDRKVTISPSSGITPVEGHRLMIGGKAHRVEAAEPVRLNNVIVRFNVRTKG